jgi:hypothetical protein
MRGLARFVRRERIADASLREAVERAECGTIDADLGGGLIKQRVARQGQGRSGGYRMMIAYMANDRAIFLLGFAKNERENVGPDELAALRALAAVWLRAPAPQIAEAVNEGVLLEVSDDQDQRAEPGDGRHSRNGRRHAPDRGDG